MSEAERITREVLQYSPTVDADPRLTIRERPTTVEPVPAVPELMDGLERLEPLALGGMGVLELCHQRGLGRRIAVKRLRDPSEPGARELLAREAALTARVAHPNVVPVHDFHPESAVGPLVTMKHLLGRPWIETLADAPRHLDLPWIRRQVAVVRQVCAALEHAHTHGVLHLDVKADNIMVNRFGEVRLFDWGIALDLRNDPPRERVLGTPAFMAPEMVAAGHKKLDERTDVYLVGGCLYELIYGRGPHEADSFVLSVASVLEGARFPPSQAPPELVEIATRALAPDPADRYASMARLRQALDAFDRHLDSIRLATEAAARLESSELPLRERERLVHRFQAALTLWPGNQRALQALSALRLELLDRYLQSDDLEMAQRTATTLETVPPAVAERLEAAQNRRDDQRAAHTELERRAQLDQQADRAIGGSVALMWVLLMVGYVLRSVLLPDRISDATVFLGVTSLVAVGAALVLSRREVWTGTMTNRTAAMVVSAGMAGIWTNHLASLLDPRPIAHVYALDVLLLGTATLSGAAIRIDRQPVALLVLALGSAALAAPSNGSEVALAGVSTLLVGGLVVRWLRNRRTD